MRIAGFQKLTLLDYPGKVAATLFTPGCNFRCPFCHNASLVLTPGETPLFEEEEVLAYLKKRQGILEGVCITGGEPTLQGDLADFIRKLKSIGYAVKLDTNGSFPERLFPLLDEGLLDYVAMDIKSSPENYEKVAGVSLDLQKLEMTVRRLIGGSIPYEFRTTVVKGLHTKEDFSKLGKFIEGAESWYLQSYVDSGDVIDPVFSAFSKEECAEFLEEVRPFVKNCALRGI
ncbi:MAG: anaerobic ribonucleoside-triphosphate reductase activating protein [Clostridia bacterium]|nr:anaerobic ribonucleoside-triphosphate reductase activating protein [Clostridia bacterium]